MNIYEYFSNFTEYRHAIIRTLFSFAFNDRSSFYIEVKITRTSHWHAIICAPYSFECYDKISVYMDIL